MIVSGRTFDLEDVVGRQYCRLVGSPLILSHNTDDPIFYKCKLCSDVYQHWLCSDRVWQSLPERLHDKKLCLRCLWVVRRLESIIGKR